MAQKTAAMPQAALASVKRSATRNSRIIEKCLGRSALGIVRSIGSGVTLQQPKPRKRRSSFPYDHFKVGDDRSAEAALAGNLTAGSL